LTALRTGGLVAALVTLALAIVYIRAEQARSASRMLAHQSRWIELRRELWKAQSGVARLRAPARLYSSLELFRADVVLRNVSKDSDGATRFAGKPLRD